MDAVTPILAELKHRFIDQAQQLRQRCIGHSLGSRLSSPVVPSGGTEDRVVVVTVTKTKAGVAEVGLTDEGETLHDAPNGAREQARDTAWAKPYNELTFSEYCAVPPKATVALEEEPEATEREKSGVAALSTTV